MALQKRLYPVGIQSFEKLRTGGYIYIDKTELLYKMITEGCPYFLSRPRRFGKSLLLSTLAAIFEGRRDLFEAFTCDNGIEQPELFIATTDWKWEKHPVIRFDFSAGDMSTIQQLDTLIDSTLRIYEKKYDIEPDVPDTNVRMKNILRISHEHTGQRAVVLVDEYDNFILHSLGDREKTEMARSRFQNLFGPLKEMDDHIEFAFITGISKFSQMGVFSKLNQLKNISIRDDYATICGISEQELTTQLAPDIQILADRNSTGYDEMLKEVKKYYDGYHFSQALVDIYNPFSLFNALDAGTIDDYWFDRGTSGALIKMLAQMPPIDITDIESNIYPSTMFDLPFDNFDNPLPILYQSGYLTIKSAEHEDLGYYYSLGIPNNEVRRGFAECLYKHVAGKGSEANGGRFFQAYFKFRRSDDLPAFINAIKAFYAGVPYQWERDNKNEHYYHALLYTLLMAFGADIRAEEPTSKGCSDLTLFMPKGIYVFEIKYGHQEGNDEMDDKLALEALNQIDNKGYAEKYRIDGRPVTKVGIAFSPESRNIVAWKAVPLS